MIDSETLKRGLQNKIIWDLFRSGLRKKIRSDFYLLAKNIEKSYHFCLGFFRYLNEGKNPHGVLIDSVTLKKGLQNNIIWDLFRSGLRKKIRSDFYLLPKNIEKSYHFCLGFFRYLNERKKQHGILNDSITLKKGLQNKII